MDNQGTEQPATNRAAPNQPQPDARPPQPARSLERVMADQRNDAESWERARHGEPQPADSIMRRAGEPAPGEPEKRGAPDQGGPKVKLGDTEFLEQDVLAAIADKATRDNAKAAIPTPADYALDLPADLKLPEGVEFKFNEDDPITGPTIAAAREFAHAMGMDQAGFSRMLGLYASSQAHEMATINAAAAAELQKLGPAAQARIDSVAIWLKAHLGAEVSKPILQTMVTSNHVKGFERLMTLYSSQGAGSFNQNGRDPGPSERISDEQWDAMSYSDKRAFAEKHSRK